jgi:hypothetical protein
MASMIVALLGVLAVIGAAVWLVTDARRRRAPAPVVGGIDLFSGLVMLGLMALHLSAVIGRAISGRVLEVRRFRVRLPVYALLQGRAERGEKLLVTRTITYDIHEAIGDSAEAIRAYSADIDLTWLAARGETPREAARRCCSGHP